MNHEHNMSTHESDPDHCVLCCGERAQQDKQRIAELTEELKDLDNAWKLELRLHKDFRTKYEDAEKRVKELETELMKVPNLPYQIFPNPLIEALAAKEAELAEAKKCQHHHDWERMQVTLAEQQEEIHRLKEKHGN